MEGFEHKFIDVKDQVLESVSVKVSRVMKDVTITLYIKGLSVWKIRIWIAIKIMKMASWIGGFGLELIEERDE